MDDIPVEQGGADPSGWEAPPRRPPAPGSAPVLSVDGFEGPLDWLIELVRARRIDLAKLSIAALVDAFASAMTAALAEADRLPLTLARWGDWLVMAADLALLRSRLLVPDDAIGVQGAKDAAEALRTRLLSRAAMAAVAEWLARRDQVGRDVFTRGTSDGAGAGKAPRTMDLTALLRACLAAIRLPPDAGSLYCVPALPPWSMANAVARIRALLPTVGEEGVALPTFLPELPAAIPEPERWCRSAVANTFLAGLELTRDGSIAVKQEIAWAPINVSHGQPPTFGELAAIVS
jgi:segregation and condensation protein A